MDTSGNYLGSATAIQNLIGTSDATLTLADLKENYAGFTYKKGQVDGADVTTTTILGNGSRIIKLYYERNRYTINYNSNGGTANVPTSHAQAYETQATVKFDKLPTKTEGVFLGWSENASSSAPTYTAGGNKEVVIETNNITLYAIWHNHIASCYSTVCRGSFIQSNSNENYYTCIHTHSGNSTSGGGCYGSKNEVICGSTIYSESSMRYDNPCKVCGSSNTYKYNCGRHGTIYLCFTEVMNGSQCPIRTTTYAINCGKNVGTIGHVRTVENYSCTICGKKYQYKQAKNSGTCGICKGAHNIGAAGSRPSVHDAVARYLVCAYR